MGQRFLLHRCGPKVSYYANPLELNESLCPLYRNLDLARVWLQRVGLKLDKATEHEDLLELTDAEYPLEFLERYKDQDPVKINGFLSGYWKSLERYADPDRLLQTLEQVRTENMLEVENRGDPQITRNAEVEVQGKRKSYLELCMQARCCGPLCEGIMHRNVVGDLRAYDQDMSAAHWGEHFWSKEQSEFASSGQDLKSWSA
ncbi:hypothetical protein BGZ65_012192 [Modicella reniformis]|uniref:Uncharacterized protein n=1 Tax=Modicella reniformis TaxID=1440133 RepID=A0A9P6MCT8_9FUNG|nr:hypothetical protein BGZ65_012192 [Modicella reniformis]